MKNGRKWRVRYLLHADNLILCDKSEESLRGLVKEFGSV